MLRLKNLGLLAAIAILIATPVLAATANFGKLTLSPGFKNSEGSGTGYTSGSFSLSSLANQDIHHNPCIGYGDPKPDYIMVLQKKFPSLTVKVDTGGKDTTLVIKGPNDTYRCGDDTGNNKDASVVDSNWEAGEYSIWVGSIAPGQTWNYKLYVRQ